MTSSRTPEGTAAPTIPAPTSLRAAQDIRRTFGGPHFTCYIDEAGDEGVNTGGTQWFLVAGVIVREDEDRAVSLVVDAVRSQLGADPSRPLHWKNLRHEKKRVFMRALLAQPLVATIVAVRKDCIDATSILQTPPWLYNYCVRYLVERVTWFVGESGGRCNLIFSNRAATKYADLEAYIRQLVESPQTEVKNVIDGIAARDMSQVKMLQVADAVAGAAFNGLDDGNRFHLYEERYILELAPKLYRRKSNLRSYGFKILCREDALEGILRSRPWLRALNKGHQ